MPKKAIEAPHPRLTLLAESGVDAPLTLELQPEKILRVTLWVSASFLLMGLGTLFFFRELELNRKLTDRVLELEATARLDALTPRTLPVEDLKKSAAKSAPVAQAEAPVVAHAPARIQGFTTQCKDVTCEVAVDLIPATAGVAQGEVLFVLETELVRIGNTPLDPGAVRKRFLVQPGEISKDALSPEEVSQLSGKPYRFTRALKTQVSFNVGRSLHPIAINLYLFDSAKTLIQHERRVVEMETLDAQ